MFTVYTFSSFSFFAVGCKISSHRTESPAGNMFETASSSGTGCVLASDGSRSRFTYRSWPSEFAENKRTSFSAKDSYGVLHSSSQCATLRCAQQKQQSQHRKRSLRTSKLGTSRSTSSCSNDFLWESGSAEANSRSLVSSLLCTIRPNWKIYCNSKSSVIFTSNRNL